MKCRIHSIILIQQLQNTSVFIVAASDRGRNIFSSKNPNMDQKIKKPLDDTWTYQQVLTPFPSNAVKTGSSCLKKELNAAFKASGENNAYVALFYRHGKPVMGKAWNECGVVQCEFAVDGKVIGGRDVGGKIQLLTYEGDHEKNRFFYEWIPLAKLNAAKSAEIVHCGSACPIFWPVEHQLGNYDVEKKKAYFSIKEKVVEIADGLVLQHMLILLRNTEGPQPHCKCSKCAATANTDSRKPLMINDWGDFLCGNDFPLDKPVVRALGRWLRTSFGEQEQYEALWYRHGKPLMGKAMRNKKGKLDAVFTDGGKVYSEAIGSLQILVEVPATLLDLNTHGFHMKRIASRYQDKDFVPVHISQMAPCVLVDEKGFEQLGQVNMKNERAEAEFNGNVMVLEGPQIRQLKVLCRKDRDDTFCI